MTSPPTPRLRVAAIIVEADALLLVKHQKEGHSYWMLPGGGVDPGESLTDALVRELREEVGITIQPKELVLANDSIPPDGHRHIINLYFTAERLAGDPCVGKDPRIVEVAFVPLSELGQIKLFPDFGDTLHELIAQGFPSKATYLGNLWNP